MTPDAAERMAARWIARLQADDRTVQDQRDWRLWLETDPAHRAAFERLSLLWDLVPGSGAATTTRRPALTRRRVMAGLGATVATGGAMLCGQMATAGTRVSTGIGERRGLRLQDGSHLVLDALTQVTLAGWPDYRRMWLDAGRIELAIAPGERPFVATAGGSVLRATGGRFDVRRDPGDTVMVTGIAGQAQVFASRTVHALHAGLRWTADRAGGKVEPQDLAATRAWHDGRAVFHADRIADVAREANRYSAMPLVAGDATAAAMRVSGVYRMGDNAALAEALATLHGLTVEQRADAIVLRRKI
ncbi:FecR family protein [Sphingomonas sp. 1P08PE]|uniref:FecR family protein n=1 Tax=Sphingomonas sp. 1P08PE TaxID=554122 RepID=UPI0039A18D41